MSAMLGPSGCGKSTILNILSGLLKPTGGAGIERKGSIGYMFQRDHLLDWRTIYENVLLGLEIQKQKKSERHLQKVERLLRTYDLWEFQEWVSQRFVRRYAAARCTDSHVGGRP